ncbi:hypothetical protein NX871_27915 [Burkholderia thailandensis]|uniref:hypothetical protein n=1 Tax=Burkholderia thailandensis TaxID=57975 RepID=UPI0012E99082|nr:hypothetical protein [Burkholderia thailandensis]MCS6473741.1 hypothetical protein [Burkholderia thailandensis]MUV25283.1 hypothetical protein [Burkholderia thailandensis]
MVVHFNPNAAREGRASPPRTRRRAASRSRPPPFSRLAPRETARASREIAPPRGRRAHPHRIRRAGLQLPAKRVTRPPGCLARNEIPARITKGKPLVGMRQSDTKAQRCIEGTRREPQSTLPQSVARRPMRRRHDNLMPRSVESEHDDTPIENQFRQSNGIHLSPFDNDANGDDSNTLSIPIGFDSSVKQNQSNGEINARLDAYCCSVRRHRINQARATKRPRCRSARSRKFGRTMFSARPRR